MEIRNGVYRLVAGDGSGFCVEVRDSRIFPLDPGGKVEGVIRVEDRKFVLNRWDEALRINADHTLARGDDSYRFSLDEG